VHFFTRGRIEEKDIKGVHYHYCWPSANNIVDYCRNMSSLMVERFSQYDSPPFDVLHFHDWHVVEAMHLLKGRNTVFTYHSTEFGRIGGVWRLVGVPGDSRKGVVRGAYSEALYCRVANPQERGRVDLQGSRR